jgi:hypothetical protein
MFSILRNILNHCKLAFSVGFSPINVAVRRPGPKIVLLLLWAIVLNWPDQWTVLVPRNTSFGNTGPATCAALIHYFMVRQWLQD